jgi:CheY-like chemotaxis protein
MIMVHNSPPLSLRGCRILVVEDEMLVSILLEDLLQGGGCEIVGPAARLGRAIDLATTETIDAALLDLNIDRREVYPVAEILAQRAIPFAFVSGYSVGNVRASFRNRPTLQKPFQTEELERVLRLMLSEATPRLQNRPGP